MNCKLKSFHANEGVISLTWWIEKMEYVFEISFCLEDCKVKLATCTLADAALTWWDRYAKTIGVSNANAISWSELKKNMIKEY